MLGLRRYDLNPSVNPRKTVRVPAAARLGGTQTLLFAERRRQVVPESVAPCFSFGDADAVRDLKQAYALAQQQDGTR